MKTRYIVASFVMIIIPCMLLALPKKALSAGFCLGRCTPGTGSCESASFSNSCDIATEQCQPDSGSGTENEFLNYISANLRSKLITNPESHPMGKVWCANPPTCDTFYCQAIGSCLTSDCTWQCSLPCITKTVGNIQCGQSCTANSLDECSSDITNSSCENLGSPLVPEWRCVNKVCKNDPDCNCDVDGDEQVDNTCRVSCRYSVASSANSTCQDTVSKCKAGLFCPGDNTNVYRETILSSLKDGVVPQYCEPPFRVTGTGMNELRYYNCDSKCTSQEADPENSTGGECKKVTRTQPPEEAGEYFTKIGCSGRCPGNSGGPPAEGPCIACGKPEDDSGVCDMQPNGEVFDSCCPGSVAQAEDTNSDGEADTCICNPSKDAVYSLFQDIGSLMLPVAIILGLFLIVLKGYGIMTSQGDPAKLQESKEGLTSAIIGLIFVLMAVSILRVIIQALISGNADMF